MTSDVSNSDLSILIIDDSIALRSITADILESHGYRVSQAGTGGEGIDLFKEKPFDLIILDVNMPDMDGAETYRELLVLSPTVNVIIYSTDSQTAVSKRFAPLAIPYYLHKPVDMTVLLETVKSLIQGPDSLTHSNCRQDECIYPT